MRRFRPIDNFLVWSVVESAAMTVAAWIMWHLLALAGADQVGRSIAPATVLLSVAVAIVIQLWVKLNDLSALASLTREERLRLWMQVRYKVRALVWLVIFFVSFIFFVLAASALAAAHAPSSGYLLTGVGAGFGACLVLIAGVLVDLNEVALFRWTVETSDQATRRTTQILGELRKSDTGFESDENIQGYKRVSGEQ